MPFDDGVFAHAAASSGVSDIDLGTGMNIAWRMGTPMGGAVYTDLIGLPSSMPPFRYGRIWTGDPMLRMHPLVSCNDNETRSITYVSQSGKCRVWIDMGMIPATYQCAIGSMRGKPLDHVIGHPSFEGCLIDNVCMLGEEIMIGFRRN